MVVSFSFVALLGLMDALIEPLLNARGAAFRSLASGNPSIGQDNASPCPKRFS
jgi:hypothetical protein